MKNYAKLFAVSMLFAFGFYLQSCTDLSGLDPNGSGAGGKKDTTNIPIDTTIHRGHGGDPMDSMGHHGHGPMDSTMGKGHHGHGNGHGPMDSTRHNDTLTPPDSGRVHMIVKLPYHQSFTLTNGKAIISFTDLAGDNRCPRNVTCVTAGNAAPNFTISSTQVDGTMINQKFVLNTDQEPKVYSDDKYIINLIALDPYPGAMTQNPWSPDMYIATLEIISK